MCEWVKSDALDNRWIEAHSCGKCGYWLSYCVLHIFNLATTKTLGCTQWISINRCKALLGKEHKPCGAPMYHFHKGGIEYDYCRVCYPKADPEMKYSILCLNPLEALVK